MGEAIDRVKVFRIWNLAIICFAFSEFIMAFNVIMLFNVILLVLRGEF